jgi:hypothetical protein
MWGECITNATHKFIEIGVTLCVFMDSGALNIYSKLKQNVIKKKIVTKIVQCGYLHQCEAIYNQKYVYIIGLGDMFTCQTGRLNLNLI